jgi:hypothetical protein
VANIVSVLRAEMGAMVAPLLFFAIGFNAIALTVALIGPDHDFNLVAHGVATVGALIAAKAVLLVDHLPFVNRYPDRPLIWNTLWKAALYALCAVALHVAERAIEAAAQPGAFAAAAAQVFAALDWRRAAAVHLWLVILFAIFAAWRELARVDGTAHLRRLFFGESRP